MVEPIFATIDECINEAIDCFSKKELRGFVSAFKKAAEELHGSESYQFRPWDYNAPLAEKIRELETLIEIFAYSAKIKYHHYKYPCSGRECNPKWSPILACDGFTSCYTAYNLHQDHKCLYCAGHLAYDSQITINGKEYNLDTWSNYGSWEPFEIAFKAFLKFYEDVRKAMFDENLIGKSSLTKFVNLLQKIDSSLKTTQ
ncbi:MAG: hypothetical protein HY929_03555 [Euryarchaeota archaeon]|nr:hypothetical protein [Euryarchaeota archaeon]